MGGGAGGQESVLWTALSLTGGFDLNFKQRLPGFQTGVSIWIRPAPIFQPVVGGIGTCVRSLDQAEPPTRGSGSLRTRNRRAVVSARGLERQL